jgi:putative serine protease PepD
VIAIGAGAAVVSSLLTAGLVTALDQNGAPASSTASSAAAVPSAASAPLVAADGTTPDWVTVAATVEPSVVSVQVAGPSGSGEGSGIVLDTAGHVVTNNHVAADSSGGGTIAVVLSDGRSFAATIVGTDPSTDLAVIKLNSPPSGLKPAAFGDSSTVKVGQQVMAIGNPLGLSDTVTTGIVSAVDRPVTTGSSAQQSPFGGSTATSEPVVTNAIQTDAAINPGNSGGALVDSGGRVIGITSSIASLGSSAGGQSGNIGLGFAIPANPAKDVATQLIENKTVEHAYLGVTLADAAVSVNGAQRQAAVIGSVTAGTPAARAGLRARDAVIAVNGKALDSSESLVARVRELRPGTKVTLTVVRGGASQDVVVTLAARPASG